MAQEKQCYKIQNWRAYNETLANRGSLTPWFEDAQIERWHQPERSGYRGSPMTCSDMAIREFFRLPLRTTEGFLKSSVNLLKSSVNLLAFPLPVPDYSALCRRQQILSVALPRPVARQPRRLVVDSAGLKVYGEGEWKVRRLSYQLKAARFPVHRDLMSFDWQETPLRRNSIEQQATAALMDQACNLILVGHRNRQDPSGNRLGSCRDTSR